MARAAGALALLAALASAAPASAKPNGGAEHADSKAVAGAKVRRVRSGPHLRVKTGNLLLTDVAEGRLERIAARYFKATQHKLVITGGTRTPERQAELMLEKMVHGEDMFVLYDKAPAAEILDAYREGVKKHFGKRRMVRAIRETIEAQIHKDVYVSRHLVAGAADVRSLGMTPARVAAFRAAVAAEPGVVILDERDATQPHLHLSLL